MGGSSRYLHRAFELHGKHDLLLARAPLPKGHLTFFGQVHVILQGQRGGYIHSFQLK